AMEAPSKVEQKAPAQSQVGRLLKMVFYPFRKRGNSLSYILTSLLRFYWIRYHFVRLRYAWLKKRIQIIENHSSNVGQRTLGHNLSAFQCPGAVFGCGGRMGLLIYPIVSYFA